MNNNSSFRKRSGASLINVCVFFLAATMIVSQVFFFSTTTTETLAEETKAAARRFSMDRKLDIAFSALKNDDVRYRITSAPVPQTIAFSNNVGWKVYDASGMNETKLVSFDAGTSAWSDDVQQIYIYNLDYTLVSLDYICDSKPKTREQVAERWDAVAKTPHKVIFPPMGPDRFLVRVLSEGQGLGKKLMYQVVVSRDSSVIPYKIMPLTFQEVWYE